MKLMITIATLLCSLSLTVAAEKIAVNDVVLNYEVHGEGKPLLLVHGGSGSIDSVRSLIAPLAEEFSVYAVDLREHGYSTASPKALSYGLETSDLKKMIVQLGLGTVSFVGHSDGGIVGLMLARDNPELIGDLVVIGANYHFNGLPDSVRTYFKGLSAETASQSAKDGYLKHSASLDGFDSFIEELKHLWLNSPELEAQQLSSIASPTLVVVGDNDFISLEHTESMFRAIPNSQLFVVPGSEHSLSKMNMELLNFGIDKFLQRNSTDKNQK